MFLGARATQAEYFDSPHRTLAEQREAYAWLGRVNRITRFERPFRLWIPRLLGEANCRQLTFLDLGAGDGSLGRTLHAWAAARGWDWHFTCLDLSPIAAQLDPGGTRVTGSALAVPFADASFDVVIATTMTHHLSNEAAVVTHFREAERTARRAVLLVDLHRNALFHAVLWLLLVAMRSPAEFRADGTLSVRRGWRVAEWQRLAALTGLRSSRVWMEHGTRVLLSLVK